MSARRITEPEDVDHPELREMAETARGVTRLAEALRCAEDMQVIMQALEDDAEESSPTSARPGEETLWELIVEFVEERWEDADRALEERLIEWLAKDHEHWPIYRLVVLDPWWLLEERRWHDETPGWVKALSTNAVIAHHQQDPYGRRRTADWLFDSSRLRIT